MSNYKSFIGLSIIILLSFILLSYLPYFTNGFNDFNPGLKNITPFSYSYSLQISPTKNRDEITSSERRLLKKVFKGENIIPYDNLLRDNTKIAHLLENNILQKTRRSFYLFGTDTGGRPVAKLIVIATRNILFLVFTTALVSTIIGTLIGILNGFVLNRENPKYLIKIKNISRFITSSIANIPMLPLIFGVYLFNEFFIQENIIGLSSYQKCMISFIILGLIYFSTILAISVENHIINLNKLEFLSAAEGLGVPIIKIVFDHIIKTNLGAVLIPQILLIGIQVIFLEITLSFGNVNMGIDLSDSVSYGVLINMMKDNYAQPINVLTPVVFAMLLASLFNFLRTKMSMINIK